MPSPIGPMLASLICGMVWLFPQSSFAAAAPAASTPMRVGADLSSTHLSSTHLSSIHLSSIQQVELLIAPVSGTSAVMLIDQATLLAQQQVMLLFSQQPAVTQLKLYVSADYGGQLVPVLLVTVDRASWQARSDIRNYVRFLDTGGRLLGLQPTGQPALTAPLLHRSIGRNLHQDDIAFRDD